MECLQIKDVKTALWQGDVPRDVVEDLYKKFGLPMPFPEYTKMVIHMSKALHDMDCAVKAGAGSGGSVAYEEFSRYIGRSRLVSAEDVDRMKANAKRSIVGRDVTAADVPSSVKVLLVRLKEVRGLREPDDPSVAIPPCDPSVVLSLRCATGGVTALARGRQVRKSSVHGGVVGRICFDVSQGSLCPAPRYGLDYHYHGLLVLRIPHLIIVLFSDSIRHSAWSLSPS